MTTSTLASDSFIGLVDKGLVKIAAQVIDSPHVQLELSLVLVYHAFLFVGCGVLSAPETTKFLPSIYLKCLQAVPRWQKQAKGSIMDLVAASLMVSFSLYSCGPVCLLESNIWMKTWVTVEYFDYHLSWKFHCEACRFAHILGYTQIDGGSNEDYSHQSDRMESKVDIEIKRKGFWQLMRTEMLFRLYYNKPPVLTATPWTVEFPSLMIPTSQGYPDGISTVVFIVSSRMTLLKMEFFAQIQNQPASDETGIQALHKKIDQICDEIENLMRGWKMVSPNPAMIVWHMALMDFMADIVIGWIDELDRVD